MKMVDNSVFNVVQSFPWEQNVIKIGLRKLKLKKIINNNIGFARKMIIFHLYRYYFIVMGDTVLINLNSKISKNNRQRRQRLQNVHLKLP